jgi:hypothetical protein
VTFITKSARFKIKTTKLNLICKDKCCISGEKSLWAYNKDQFYPNIVCPFIGLLKVKKSHCLLDMYNMRLGQLLFLLNCHMFPLFFHQRWEINNKRISKELNAFNLTNKTMNSTNNWKGCVESLEPECKPGEIINYLYTNAILEKFLVNS